MKVIIDSDILDRVILLLGTLKVYFASDSRFNNCPPGMEDYAMQEYLNILTIQDITNIINSNKGDSNEN